MFSARLIPARGATVVKLFWWMPPELHGTCEVREVNRRARRSIERVSTTQSSLGISMERKVYVQRTGALKQEVSEICFRPRRARVEVFATQGCTSLVAEAAARLRTKG